MSTTVASSGGRATTRRGSTRTERRQHSPGPPAYSLPEPGLPTAWVGLDVVTAYRRSVEGLWEAAADHTDCVVEQGRYESEEWVGTITAYNAESAPDGPDEEYVGRTAGELAEAQQGWQIDEAEVERRTERAHRRLLENLDDELVLERARELGAGSPEGAGD